MALNVPPSEEFPPFVPRQRWATLESRFGERIRASEAAWVKGLSAADRLQIVEELLEAVRAAHVAAGDWPAVQERAWRETLAERRRFVHAFRRLDEVTRGRTPLADAR